MGRRSGLDALPLHAVLAESEGQMSEMIDRVARASFACWRRRMTEKGHHLDKGQTFEEMSESEQEFAYLHAEAIISAMREPTEAMLDTGSEAMPESADPDEVWKAMIDEALK